MLELVSADELIGKSQTSVSKMINLLEVATLNFLEDKAKASREEYFATIMPKADLLKVALIPHVNVEELALYPILILKSEKALSTVLILRKEHHEIMERFQEFEHNKQNYEASIATLTDITHKMRYHLTKEDILYSSITLSNQEEARFKETASLIERHKSI